MHVQEALKRTPTTFAGASCDLGLQLNHFLGVFPDMGHEEGVPAGGGVTLDVPWRALLRHQQLLERGQGGNATRRRLLAARQRLNQRFTLRRGREEAKAVPRYEPA